MLTVGQRFPDFDVQACTGNTPDDLVKIDNKTYSKKWSLFIFYPKDFTFVCPTELVEFSNRKGDFDKLDVQLIGGSTDNEFSHLTWRNSHPELGKLTYPLIAAQRLAFDLGIVHETENVCLRATFLVDSEGVIQWASANSLPVGRNVDEVLRVIEAVQSGELCACNWSSSDAHL